MKLLITGATGFIGSNLLIRALQHPDIESVVVVIRNHCKLERLFKRDLPVWPEKLLVLENDITECRNFPDGVTHAVHCAGELFTQDISSFYRVNCGGTLSLFAALPPQIPSVVLSSQSVVGPTPKGALANTEKTFPLPISNYGKSKLLMEQLLETVRPNSPTWILRPPIVLGPRDLAIQPLLRMVKSPVRLKLGCATKSYSWIAIDDLISAIFTALQSPKQPQHPTPYFVCSNGIISDENLINEAARAINRKGLTIGIPHCIIKIASQLGRLVPVLTKRIPSLTPDRVSELFPNRWIIDDTLFREATGWKPTQTLSNTMDEIAAWKYGQPAPAVAWASR